MEQKVELLPLTNDYVFKRVFTKDGEEDLLKDLLSAILNIEIKEIEIKNPEMTKESKEAKREVLDIRAKVNNNSIIDIEVQVRNYYDIDRRSIGYLTKMYSDQLKAGDAYEKPLKTISINILNFNFFKRNAYHSIARIKFEKDDKDKYVDMEYDKEDEYVTEDLEVHYIELPKFIKKNPGVKTKLEQWLWLICGEEGGKVEMAKEENEKVKEASEVLERMSMSYEERWLYDQRMLRKMDEMSLKEHAKQERNRRKQTRNSKENVRRRNKYRNYY